MNEALAEQQKTALRRRWKERLAAGFRRDADENEKLCQQIKNDSAFLRARQVALYAPRAWEVDLLSLWRARPQACVFPRVRPGTRQMDFFRVTARSDLVAGFGGILEPRANDFALVTSWEVSDLVLLPGFYYDRFGIRLGSGLGFYDRFLAGKTLTAWGVCWTEQFLTSENLIALPHDIPVSRVVTPTAAHLTVAISLRPG